MSTVPLELNWIKERAACTVGKVFNQICDEIVKDVSTVNTVHKLDPTIQFKATMHSDGSTIFVGQPNVLPRARVLIGVQNDWIVVNEEWRGTQWGVTIGLNDSGRCVLRLEDGTELEHWQVRKRALEGLFFVEPLKGFL
jgi:hypothetical protein